MGWSIRDKLIAAFGIVIISLTLPVIFFFINGYSTLGQYQKIHQTVFVEGAIRQQCEEVAGIIPLLIAKDSQKSILLYEEKRQSITNLLIELRITTQQQMDQRQHQVFEIAVKSYLESCDRVVQARRSNDLKEVTAHMEQALFKGGIINREASKLIADEIDTLAVNQKGLMAGYWQSLLGGIILLLFLIAACIAFIYSFSGGIRHDLSQILHALNQVANGSVEDIRLTPRSQDEIGDLALKFNWMIQRLDVVLQERDGSDELLRQSYVEMENKVDIRTQELSALNQELIATNEELQATVSRLHLTQANLIQAEKMAALGTLVTGMAHELNTPVGNCIMLSTHLEDSTAGIFAHYQKNSMTRIQLENYLQDNHDFCRSLILNLTTTAKMIQSFKKSSIDPLAEKLTSFSVSVHLWEMADLVMPQLRKAEIDLQIRCKETIMLKSYLDAFTSVILNLLQNSLLHAFPTGQQGVISLEVVVREELLYIDYRDNGIGLTPMQLRQIFEPFFTTKRGQGCVGLGLYTVFNIVTRLLGGSISCASQAGQGILFTLELPLKPIENMEMEGMDIP